MRGDDCYMITPGLHNKISASNICLPGAGLLRNLLVTLSTLRLSRGWVRKDGNLLRETGCTVSFHNFKSQNFKLSVSNPKNKYVAYLSVLSQISNCQRPGVGLRAATATWWRLRSATTYRRRKLFCIESALHTPCSPVSMLALEFAAGGVMNIHVGDGVSERSQHWNGDTKGYPIIYAE